MAEARDITQKFTRAASALNTGQLVKDELFTLFDAVGALEIMDSKMDSGYLAPGETLDDDYDVLTELLPEEVVGIMDQLLCHEVAWHMGHPLSQTLFTSVYLDHLLWPVPSNLDDARFGRQTAHSNHKSGPADRDSQARSEGTSKLVSLVLRAYCLSLIKACDRVLARVIQEYFYEEEDFVTHLYNRNLLSGTSSDKILVVLDEAITWIEKGDHGFAEDVTTALKDRLVFRRAFLWVLDLDTDIFERRETQNMRESLRLVELIAKSTTLGKPVENAFSLKIQRRLASSVPPRPMVNIKFDDAISYMTRFFQDMIDMQDVLEYGGTYNLRNAIWALQSRKPQPAVYIRSLCQAMVMHEMRVLGSLSVKQFLFDELASLVLPSSQILDSTNEKVEAPSDFRFKLAKQMDEFSQRMAQPFVDTYRAMCMNRSRIRRTLCHTVLDWDTLQAEAEEFDVQVRTLTLEPLIKLHGDEPTYSYPLGSWAYHQKLRQLRLIIQLGFELSIYSPEELPGMYWHLSHICSTHLAHLDRIRSCVTTAFQRAERSPVARADQQADAAKRRQAFNRTFSLLGRLTTELVWIDAFAIALHCLYALLERYTLLPWHSLRPPQSYSSESLRHELRMKPFLPVSHPEFIPFDLFKRESLAEGEKDEVILERAQSAVGEARKTLEKQLAAGPYLSFDGADSTEAQGDKKGDHSHGLGFDWVKDVKDSLRACIGTSIAIGTLKKTLSSVAVSQMRTDTTSASKDQHSLLNLSVEIPDVGSKGRWHDWWAVPQITENLPLR